MDRAIFELSEKLRHPSDIATKVEPLEKEFRSNAELHKKNFTDKMASTYRDIRAISEGIRDLALNVDRFKELQSSSIAALKDFNRLIRDSKTVNKICKAYKNFIRTRWLISVLKTVEDECIHEDVILYHRKIYEKEEFMYEIYRYNSGLEREDFSKITRVMNTIKRQSLEFTTLLIETTDDFIDNSDGFDKINRIVEIEEKRDEITRKVEEGIRSKDPVMLQYARSYPQYADRACKNLKSRLTEVIKSAIRSKFKFNRAEGVFNSYIEFVPADIERIHENIHLEFFTFDDFVTEYHKHLRRMISDNIDVLDAGEILALIEFKTDYYNLMESKYNKVPEALGERLLESESELLDRYSRTATSKLQEWIDNITVNEIEKMRSRDIEMNRDESDKLISPGFINLLQIIKMQLEPIAFSKRVFLVITSAVRANCESFKKRIIEEVQKDFELSLQGKAKPGFEDYCIMFGNSGLKLAQYVTSLPQCQSMEVRDLGNVFMSILQSCNVYQVKFVMFTCRPVLDNLFRDQWYSGELRRVFVVTLEDFLQDYKVAMSAFSFSAFLYELASSISLAYIKALGSRKITLSEQAGSLLRDDYEALKELLGEYTAFSDIEESFGTILKLLPLLETENPDVFSVEIDTLRLQYPECDEAMVRNIISRRRDLDVEIKERFLGTVKGVFAKNPKRNRLFRFNK